jgi:excisionase family DNA binding protein
MKALLRPQDVAEVLAVSKVTVYRLARTGELASVRIRGQVRFRPEAVEEYLARPEAPEPQPVAISPSPRRGRPRKQWVPATARRAASTQRRTWPSGRATYRARSYDATGQRQTASFDTKAEAEAWLANRSVAMRRGGTGSMGGRRTTLAEWWARWQSGRTGTEVGWCSPRDGLRTPC